MNIAILDLCLPHAEFDRHGSIAEMTSEWLVPHLPEAKLTSLHIAAGVALPDVDAFDGYFLTGSEKGVYDDTEWMTPLKTFLRAVRDAGRPVFGVCFGHQIMAEAFGGRAEKADTGFVVGAKTFETSAGPLNAHAMHQDQVTAVPPGATVTASAAYCPVGALAYDFPASSVQFHPEYKRNFVKDAVDIFEGDLLTTDQACVARSTFETAVDEDLYGPEVAAFFRGVLTG